jgi:hypothetical protein
MSQINSNVYTKTAAYDFNIDGAISVPGINMGIVLNPGEFVISAWYKVTSLFASAVPGVDSFLIVFNFDLFTPANVLVLTTTNGLNAGLNIWSNTQQLTIYGAAIRANNNPQGQPSNDYLQIYRAGNPNTSGSLIISCLIGSTNN